MNIIQKQKAWLIALGVIAFVVSVLFLVFGLILTINGAGNLNSATGIVKFVFGLIMLLLSVPACITGVRFVWVGCAMTATKGSIKMGNIAKDGGTVNMKKCDKCGTELKDGETECSNCGKKFE